MPCLIVKVSPLADERVKRKMMRRVEKNNIDSNLKYLEFALGPWSLLGNVHSSFPSVLEIGGCIPNAPGKVKVHQVNWN